MGGFLDFQAVKQAVSIDEAAHRLGLALKPAGSQMRGVCPACKSGGDRALVITPSKGVFYCFSAGKGGDCIALTAHIRGTEVKDAAAWLAPPAPEAPAKGKPTVPQNQGRREPTRPQPAVTQP